MEVFDGLSESDDKIELIVAIASRARRDSALPYSAMTDHEWS
jgi:hypothetical protein